MTFKIDGFTGFFLPPEKIDDRKNHVTVHKADFNTATCYLTRLFLD